jgi:hypothetical protein
MFVVPLTLRPISMERLMSDVAMLTYLPNPATGEERCVKFEKKVRGHWTLDINYRKDGVLLDAYSCNVKEHLGEALFESAYFFSVNPKDAGYGDIGPFRMDGAFQSAGHIRSMSPMQIADLYKRLDINNPWLEGAHHGQEDPLTQGSAALC